MGIDFIEKTAKSHRKGYDRAAAELATPTLFSKRVEPVRRLATGRLIGTKAAQLGETLVVERIGDETIASRGIDPVAVLDDDDGRIAEALNASGGVAGCEISEVFESSGRVEGVLC